MSRALMIQGAGSDVGKSLIVAGLARAATRRGLRVLPFKPQNMSNNAAVTVDGGEIGRAQALQAQAARVEPHTDMNPVLLKPETDVGAQVIVQGRRVAARARPATMSDLPTSEPAPWIISARDISASSPVYFLPVIASQSSARTRVRLSEAIQRRHRTKSRLLRRNS